MTQSIVHSILDYYCMYILLFHTNVGAWITVALCRIPSAFGRDPWELTRSAQLAQVNI
jgi:hypothetical protein